MDADTRNRTGVVLLESEYLRLPYCPVELVPSDAILLLPLSRSSSQTSFLPFPFLSTHSLNSPCLVQ